MDDKTKARLVQGVLILIPTAIAIGMLFAPEETPAIVKAVSSGLVVAGLIANAIMLPPWAKQAIADASQELAAAGQPQAMKRIVAKAKGRKPPPMPVLLLGALFAFAPVALLASSSSCTPAAIPIVLDQVPGDVVADIGCWTAEALQGKQTTEMGIECGAMTLAQLAQLLRALAQGGGIAMKVGRGAVISHVPRVTLTIDQRARVEDLLVHVEAAIADGGAP